MILVYSTDRAEDEFDSRGKVIPKTVSMTNVKKLLQWVKKYKRFGAYAEVREAKNYQYEVDIYCRRFMSTS